MSDDTTAAAEREEIEMLLPWYVSGRLDAADRARVEGYLARDAGLRHQLDLVRAERQEVIAANEALRTPSAGALDRLMASLPPRRPSLAERLGLSALNQTVADFFAAPSVRGVRFAAVAAALLLLAQAAVITTLLVRGDGGGTYQTASGQNDDKGVSALVVFAEDARLPAISRVLADLDASIVDGPKPGGVYKVRIRTADRSDAAREALLRKLAERRDVVRSVLPAGD
jgi:anti-sigma factor RsiW